MFVVTVDESTCIGCGECAKACPAQILEMQENLAKVVGDDCMGCQSCTLVCPVEAIKVEEY
ncbi:indolepyruvate ferredoxin oxidoreductase subunit alpha [Dendrosporobacter sp. 1207_IL3150]|uniref:indolepyruvate ferredoxin oxidoreductase subunit alpha n=1 Tax=Dendrosporobacter sp. 1207_IL3150 TaxID=3084054 RepID=UPI002FD97A4F